MRELRLTESYTEIEHKAPAEHLLCEYQPFIFDKPGFVLMVVSW